MTADEIRQRMAQGNVVIVACIQVQGQALKPGYRTGYYCVLCPVHGKTTELQASPAGQKQIAAGGVPTCNLCAFSLCEVKKPAEVHVSEDATQAMAEGHTVVGPDWVERMKKGTP